MQERELQAMLSLQASRGLELCGRVVDADRARPLRASQAET
jgi:hypothetical protein